MAWNYFLDRRRSFYAISQTSRTDVRSFYYRSVSLRLRRLTGCLYLFIPRQGLRQRPDRQHRADGRQAVCGQVGRGTALPDSPLRLCAGHFCGRVHPPQAQADAVAPLASAGGAVRDPDALRRGLFAAGAESAGQIYLFIYSVRWCSFLYKTFYQRFTFRSQYLHQSTPIR